MRELYVGEHEALAKVQLPQHLATARYALHPAFLDACLHAYPVLLYGADNTERLADSSYLPVSLTGFRCYRGRGRRGLGAYHAPRCREGRHAGDRHSCLRCRGAAGRRTGRTGFTRTVTGHCAAVSRRHGPFVLSRGVAEERQRAREEQEGSDPASWIIFADAKGVGDALARKLEASGHHCHLVYAGDTFARRAARRWTVNERQREHFARLLDRICCDRGAAV